MGTSHTYMYVLGIPRRISGPGWVMAITYVASVSPSAYSSICRNARGLLHMGHVIDASLHSLVLICVLMCAWRQARHASGRHPQPLASVGWG